MFSKTIVGEARPAGYDSATIYGWCHAGPGPQAADGTLKQVTLLRFRAKNSVETPVPDTGQITGGLIGVPDANLEHNVRVAKGYGTAVQAMPELFGQPIVA
ncbi:hypothetical protein [Allokutzneria sp. NRRL B-24872]|uniref:hypothetical protein n=1 Tax=Allokutzneria sp. NRRL B-24872 TaxID=1137961 RepID=UPI000A39D810|nr:hypothetical protein [Allokutzneria sp. NRRL B-24872]